MGTRVAPLPGLSDSLSTSPAPDPNPSASASASASAARPPWPSGREALRRQWVLLEHGLPLSVLRAVLGLLSLALVLSDVPRSGLGVRRLADGVPGAGAAYQPLQPGEFLFSGPGNSSYAALERATAADQRLRVWLYKWDAMSLVWRALALHDRASVGRAFPPCLLDERQSCAPDGGDDHAATLGGDVVFAMMDAIADGLARGPRPSRRKGAPTGTRLRTRSRWTDRAHHLLLPSLFADEVWRVHQGLHYPPDVLAAHLDVGRRPGALCFVAGPRPLFCGELFANYDRACRPADRKCRAVGLLLADVLAQARALQTRFPGLAVDLTLLDSQDDVQAAAGGLATVGFRRGEVTSLLRARNCSSAADPAADADADADADGVCETAFIVERRYASARVESDADEWFALVAVLRAAGQIYMFVRVLLLVVGCGLWARTAMGSSPTAGTAGGSSSTAGTVRGALRLLAKVPANCVVYSSPIPVLCYALAHVVDAPANYLLLHGSFLSGGGLRDVALAQFVPLAVLQMRSVWLFAALLQLAVTLHAADRFGGDGRPHPPLPPPPPDADTDHAHGPLGLRGVPGVPEYALSALSLATVAAQFRRPGFRSAQILALFEVGGAADGHRLAAVKYQHAPMAARRGAGARQLGGVLIDLKFLVAALLLLLGAWAAANAAVAALNGLSAWRARRRGRPGGSGVRGPPPFVPWRLGSRTPAPYSAGVLWPKAALAVHWTSGFFCLEPPRNVRHARQVLPQRSGASAVVFKAAGALLRSLRGSSARRLASLVMSARSFEQLQRRLERVDERVDERVGASVAFLNLVVLSDPLVLLYAARLARIPLGYYAVRDRSELPPLLLPRAAAERNQDARERLTLLAKLHASELDWCELLQCG